jgi:hypothetical protein
MEKDMKGLNSERMLGWAAALAVSALAVVAASTFAPSVVPRMVASLVGHGSAFACFGLCVLAVVIEPQRRH